MEKIKKLVKRKETLRRLVMLAGLLIALWLNFLIFGAIAGKPLNFAEAQNTIRVSLTVAPKNPVEKTSPIETPAKDAPVTDYKSSGYRLISAVPASAENDITSSESPTTATVVKSPIVTFRGKSIYPDSKVFLVMSSGKIYSSATSDSQGGWTWTNWGYPLENGEHTLEAGDLSNYDLSGKRDVFVEKYSFLVNADSNYSGMQELPLESISSVPILPGSTDFGAKMEQNNLDNVFLFDIALLNKTDYNPGDEIDMNMIFNPLGRITEKETNINYEIYNYNPDSLKQTQVYNFSDNVDLTASQAFLKKIKLKNDVLEGSYFIKVTATAGADTYIQSAKFTVRPKTLVQIGSTQIDEKQFSAAIAWDIIFIIGFAILIFILIIFEYRQMSICGLVSENTLKNKHYFSN